jgi:hypothetical protein
MSSENRSFRFNSGETKSEHKSARQALYGAHESIPAEDPRERVCPSAQLDVGEGHRARLQAQNSQI